MNKSPLITVLVMLALGFGGGYWLQFWLQGQTMEIPTAVLLAKPDKQPLFYRHPMNPEISSPVPAKGSMGMDYIPVYADSDDDTASPAGTVKIDPVVVQNIGVRTTIARLGSLSRTVRAVGRVDFDEGGMFRLHPKTEGWITQIRVENSGQQVVADEILLSLYSPKLVASQQEYLLALSNREVLASSPFEDIRRGADELVNSSRQRLLLMDAPEHQIRELEQSKQVQKTFTFTRRWPAPPLLSARGMASLSRLTPSFI
ncbi:MAG: efflux RND transporter periplasmic adaptor subunit [Immundisolibacteraceae bacterium]|nr:efflux RND transporter periplasmic adaptor subunit [Immundisolibacteraceae bacterium]